MTTTKTLRTIICRESTRLIDDWFNMENSLSVDARRLAGRIARLNEIPGLSTIAARWRMRATGTYHSPFMPVLQAK